MVYGYYISDCVGKQRFFTEGCNYCQMTTGGQHESKCPMNGIKVADIPASVDVQGTTVEYINRTK